MNKKQKKTFKFKRKKIINKYIKGGIALYLLLFVIIILSLLLSGLMDDIKPKKEPFKGAINLTCCDTGDGEACKPQEDKDKLTFQGKEYGVIRSKVHLLERNLHLKDSGEKFGEDPIIVNSSETHHATGELSSKVNLACNRINPGDLYFKKAPPTWDYFMNGHLNELPEYCTSTPDDQIVFVCKKNCFSPDQNTCPYAGNGIPCYGDDNSEYDVYFRLEDYHKSESEGGGIPNFIKNCDKSGFGSSKFSSKLEQKIILEKNVTPEDNLQLRTFKLGLEGNLNPWLSPLCKPAIYLYPEEKTDVHVKINPKGKITLTIPDYPKNGWKVIAYPDGKIESNSKSYDYLYYEAQIPNNLIEEKIDQGYITEYQKIETTLNSLLPKLGLNKKETGEFLDYWLKALPNSKYYLIGIVPQNLLDDVSPLAFTPQPDNIIRVALYFKPLDSNSIGTDQKINIKQPIFPKIERNGFTVVEWGGFYKTDPTHPFTCLM